MEKGRGKRREKRERAGGIFRSLHLELGSPDWKQRGPIATALLCCVQAAPMHRKCMPKGPERPATRNPSMAQGARSQGLISQARLLYRLSSCLLTCHSLYTALKSHNQPAPQSSVYTGVCSRHPLTAIRSWHTSSDTVTTHTQILCPSPEISYLQLPDNLPRSMLSPGKLKLEGLL